MEEFLEKESEILTPQNMIRVDCLELEKCRFQNFGNFGNGPLDPGYTVEEYKN